MEPHEIGLSSYYHQQQFQFQPPPATTATALHPNNNAGLSAGVATAAASPAANGGLFSNHGGGSSDAANATTSLYPQSVAGEALSLPVEIVRKKRGRPRKYGTPEVAAAAKAASSVARSSTPKTTSRKREHKVIGLPPSASSSSRKSQLDSEAKTGQSFVPHVINVQPGEDVAQKIRNFVQQSMQELCILSTSGSVRNVSLLQAATSGSSITYDGPFDILSLSGSFVHTDQGERSGGLSACFSATNGQIIGGRLAGPLVAVGPVEVVIATFLIKTKKDVRAGTKREASTSTLASPNSVSISTAGYRPVIVPSGRYPVPGVDDHQNSGDFMIQHQGLHMVPSQYDWSTGPDAGSGLNYNFTDHGTQESPRNGDYQHLPGGRTL